MTPYLVLLFVPLLFSFVASANKVRNQKGALLFGADSEIRNNSYMLPVFFFILFLLIALRDESVGIDTDNYKYYFNVFSGASLEMVLKKSMDILYWLLNWLVGLFTNSFQWFLATSAILTVIPIARFYCKDRQGGFLKIVLFVNMSTFVMLFSGLRQTMAMSVGLIAYEFVRKKKVLWFLFFSLVALGIHHTGFVVFSFYPLYHVAFKKRHLWFVVPSVALVFVFNEQLFVWATNFLMNLFGDKYSAEVEATGAYTMLFLFILFVVLAYMLLDESQADREVLGMRNFLLAAVMLQCFAPVHTLAMRLNYYFILFIPVLIPKILRQPVQRWRNMGRMIEIGLSCFFLLYYLYGTYTCCLTGESALNTYPYVPFWK